MKTNCRTFILTILLAFSIFSAKAQDGDKIVTITSNGSGKTQEEAQQNALRSAIEQAFGAFISSKTEILNDNLVSDQITSIANGNIQSFQILNEAQLPNNTWVTTLKAIVSVSKLTKFVESKGVTVEIKGGLFALNIKQQLLNEQGELDAVSNLVGVIHEIMQNAYDYTITTATPQSKDANSKTWVIPIVVTSKANKNSDFCANYLIKNLTAVSLSKDEEQNYKALNKHISYVFINYAGTTYRFGLRNYNSRLALKFLSQSWGNYDRLFIAQSDLSSISGLDFETNSVIANKSIVSFETNTFSYFRDYIYSEFRQNFNRMDLVYFNFYKQGDNTNTFSWEESFTLEQINQITGYKVHPFGNTSKFSHDGIVVSEKNGHGVVAASIDFDSDTWDNAKKICEELSFKNHTDWRLPTLQELDKINSISKDKSKITLLGQNEANNMTHKYGTYWCNEGFSIGHEGEKHDKNMNWVVRSEFIAVRSF